MELNLKGLSKASGGTPKEAWGFMKTTAGKYHVDVNNIHIMNCLTKEEFQHFVDLAFA